MSEKVVLAYSGGLDTSAAVQWLRENYNLDVICLTVDVGNEKDFAAVKAKAVKVGAIKAIVKDVKDEFVRGYLFPALQADALYEGQYPLATSLSRPLMAKLLVEVARAEGATAVAHGCTGKGNDQVRFDVSVGALAPDLKIIAPAREWGMTREQTIKYAGERGIPVPVTIASPYSVDENLWGRSAECGVLEDPWVEPPAEVYTWTVDPAQAPAQPAYVEISFEQGVPVALDGQALDGVSLIRKLNELGGAYGVGRIDHIENRLVGIKSREIYEAPAAVLLLQAHQALEAMTLSKAQLRFKEKVAVEYADLVYNGLCFSALFQDLTAFVQSTQRFVSGTVRLKLFKGSSTVVGRKSPFSLYSHGLATYDKGDLFDHRASPGFIHIWGLPVRTQAQAQPVLGEPGAPAALPASGMLAPFRGGQYAPDYSAPEPARETLSSLETEVFYFIGRGYSDAEIAEACGIDEAAVKECVAVVHRKLAAGAVLASTEDIVPPEETAPEEAEAPSRPRRTRKPAAKKTTAPAKKTTRKPRK